MTYHPQDRVIVRLNPHAPACPDDDVMAVTLTDMFDLAEIETGERRMSRDRLLRMTEELGLSDHQIACLDEEFMHIVTPWHF